jgi:hypothetical protein
MADFGDSDVPSLPTEGVPQQGTKRELENKEADEPQAKKARTEPTFDFDFTPSNEAPDEGFPTNVLLVTNLSRPFTPDALRELFEKHGRVQNFQLNSNRSRAVVTFDTKESAAAARKALWHGNWASSKKLELEFISADDIEAKLNPTAPKLTQEEARTDGPLNTAPAGQENGKAEEGPTRMDVDPDSLFQKTEAKPPIYFQPLSEGEVQQKKMDTTGDSSNAGFAK